MNITELLKQPYPFIDSKNIPRLDIELILAHAINKDRVFVLSHPEYKLSNDEYKKTTQNIKRRTHHEPIAYILGDKEFFGLKFKVNKHVLIPRPKTEELVDKTLHIIEESNKTEFNMIDIGTGSGCIPISILHESEQRGLNKKINFTAIDISEEALKVARKNWKTYRTSTKNVQLIFTKLNILNKKEVGFKLAGKIFDIIISNPPYIPSKEIKNLQPEIKEYEPRIALDSGKSKDYFYKMIQSNLKNNIFKNTTFLFEEE